MFAVIKTGGKQYRVSANDLLQVERVTGEPGEIIQFADVLVVGEGEDVTFGAPLVDGASVAAEVVDQGRGKKVIAFKKRRRQNSRRKRGHRQLLTTVRISEILTGGAKPSGASFQAAARAARYDLLLKACEARGIFHLALAHHLEDQAETFLLRLGRGSGLDGLAAMAPVNETSGLRLLRPLLGLAKDQLKATLSARGLDWIEDPSNDDGAYARVRLRRLLPELAGEGMTPARLGSATQNLGRARAALEADVAAALARAVRPDPAGFLDLDPAVLRRESPEVSLRALARSLMAVGGCDYTPRLERLERLHAYLQSGLAKGVTLGGCRIVPRADSLGDERWLIVREAGRSAPAALTPGGALLWDGRFEVRLARNKAAEQAEMTVGPLGNAGWRRLAAALEAAGAGARAARIPLAARGALPAIRDGRGLAAVPPVGYFRDPAAAKQLKECRFAPTNGLTSPAFTVV
ncbi:50S ribosomal protein L21 [uncultured Nitratireductor sp.]|nr:50S ribosomal protein L21 [uncultured Nitratireductor sp.]